MHSSFTANTNRLSTSNYNFKSQFAPELHGSGAFLYPNTKENDERSAAMNDDFEYRYVRGHVEVYLDGTFLCSADNMFEAREEIFDLQMEETL